MAATNKQHAGRHDFPGGIRIPTGAGANKAAISNASGDVTWTALTRAIITDLLTSGIIFTGSVEGSLLYAQAVSSADVWLRQTDGAANQKYGVLRLSSGKLSLLSVTDAFAVTTLLEGALSTGIVNFPLTPTAAGTALVKANDAALTDARVPSTGGSNDDLMQRKAGAWTNRTPAQVKTDLVLVKADVGLGNVDNTADTAKPVSTAQQTALDLKRSTATALVNADIDASAAIVKSKLAALAIVNADVDAAAAIVESKLSLASDAAAGTASRRTLGTAATAAAPGDLLAMYQQIVSPRAGSFPTAAVANAVYVVRDGMVLASAATAGQAVIHLDPAWFDTAGQALKLRVVLSITTNATAPARTYKLGLYPVSASAGSAGTDPSITVGTVLSGSEATITNPAASTPGQVAVGADFDFPTAGAYALGLYVTVSTPAAVCAAVAQLQMRRV